MEKYTKYFPTPSTHERTCSFLVYSSSFPNSPFQLRYPISLIYTSTFNILFLHSICVSYPYTKSNEFFSDVFYSIFDLSASLLLPFMIPLRLILAQTGRSYIFQLNYALSIHVRVCQHLLSASLKQNPLTLCTSEQRQRCTADAPAPHLPETKETKKIGFTMSSCILKIITFLERNK